MSVAERYRVQISVTAHGATDELEARRMAPPATAPCVGEVAVAAPRPPPRTIVGTEIGCAGW